MDTELVLVIEDEDDIRELVSYNLSKEGYRVVAVSTGEEGIAAAEARRPHAVLLDLMLPGVDGLTVCRRIRSSPRTERIPIIILTAKGEEADIVSGLNLGADDYITKPFSGKVLVARVRRLLRKAAEAADDKTLVRIHGLVIDPARHEVMLNDKPISLTLTEFNILHTLARRPGLVFTRYQIVDAIHGDNYLVTDRAIDVQIVALRRKLGSSGKLIETVRGVGYRFKD